MRELKKGKMWIIFLRIKAIRILKEEITNPFIPNFL